MLRAAFDRYLGNGTFDLLLGSGAMSAAARLVHFHRRGLFSATAWRDLVSRAPRR